MTDLRREDTETNQPPRLFGTPPADLESWLHTIINECEEYRHLSLNPLERERLKARIGGLETALLLLRYEAEQNHLPMTIAGRPHGV